MSALVKYNNDLKNNVTKLMNENKKLKSGYTNMEDDNKKLKKDFEELKEFVTHLKSGGDAIEKSEISTFSPSQYDLEMQCLELTEKVKNGQPTVYLPRNLKRIPNELFLGCKDLRHIILPPTITSIGNQAFYNCNSLQDIELPPSLTSFFFFPNILMQNMNISQILLCIYLLLYKRILFNNNNTKNSITTQI